MCVACGLPTTHSGITQAIGWLTLFSFTLATFVGAWLIVTSINLKKYLLAIRTKRPVNKSPPME